MLRLFTNPPVSEAPITVSVDRGKKRPKEQAWRPSAFRGKGYEESSKDSVMRPSSRKVWTNHE